MTIPVDRAQISRWLISLIALLTIVAPFVADWNVTHIYNPRWPPHAKFHNAHTMLLGALLGGFTLWLLWRESCSQRLAIVVAALYWLAQAGSILLSRDGFRRPGVRQPFSADRWIDAQPARYRRLLSFHPRSLLAAQPATTRIG